MLTQSALVHVSSESDGTMAYEALLAEVVRHLKFRSTCDCGKQ